MSNWFGKQWLCVRFCLFVSYRYFLHCKRKIEQYVVQIFVRIFKDCNISCNLLVDIHYSLLYIVMFEKWSICCGIWIVTAKMTKKIGTFSFTIAENCQHDDQSIALFVITQTHTHIPFNINKTLHKLIPLDTKPRPPHKKQRGIFHSFGHLACLFIHSASVQYPKSRSISTSKFLLLATKMNWEMEQQQKKHKNTVISIIRKCKW